MLGVSFICSRNWGCQVSPMAARTGASYIEALRDGRQVWQGGRRIEDVTTHPGFVGNIHTVADLYDLQHTPELGDAMTAPWGDDLIAYGWLPPRTLDELLAKRRNIEIWSERTLGYMGRYPEFCAELVVGLLDFSEALAEDNPRFGENARGYHRLCAERDLCLTHALNEQYYDRSKRIADQPDPDLILHVVGETSDGPIVRGVKNLATLAATSDDVLVYSSRPRQADEADYSMIFALPMNAPGLSIICRDLYAEHADPERLPLTSRFDEVDTTLVFDDVLVPWERVFAYRNPALAVRFFAHDNGLWASYTTLIRLIVKLETFAAVADLLCQWAGRARDTKMQTQIGQILSDLTVLRACARAAEADAFMTPGGHLAPAMVPAYRLEGNAASDRAEQIFEELLTSSLMLTGGVSDLPDPKIGPYIERFFRNNAPSTRDHLRVLAIAGDMVQSAFGGRNQLYERLHAGEPDVTRQRVYAGSDRASATERILRFIHDGWDR